ncbi:MAG: hypothetical protein OXM02_09245 [Bacteroidota bacterium]|nr:hypothetical protein [Bacteroidota bacterium]
MAYNGTYFIVGDPSRIQVLSQDFEYIASLPPQKSELLPGTGLVATENYIYTSCRRGSEYRVCPRSAEPPLQKEGPFLQSIGITSPPMDGIAFGATPNGSRVVVAFVGLPYPLIFNDSHEHIHTLRLASAPVTAHAGNYTMSRPGVPGTGLRISILRVHVLNDEFLAVPIRDIWHFIRIGSNGRFDHVGAARIMESEESDARPVMAMSQALMYGDHMFVYANDVPHLLRYPFPY